MLELGLDTFGDVTAGADGHLLQHAQVIRNVIDEAALADQLGVDCFGAGEHHRADFAVSSPEIVLATIAGLTKRIRLSSAVTVLSSDDPVRVYQRFSTLNAATQGRAEIILGRGSFTESFRLFGHDLADYKELFEEKLDLFVRLIRQDSITWRGKTRAALTHQRVYPRLEAGALKTWLGVGATPESVLRAAQYDLPLMLGIIGGEPARFRPLVDLYHSAFAKLGRPSREVAVHSAGHVADSDTQAREELWAPYRLIRDRIGAERGWPPIERPKFELEIDRGSLYVGAPETVARKIATTVKSLGLARFNMKYGAGPLPQKNLMRCIELYGRRVIPLVHDMLR